MRDFPPMSDAVKKLNPSVMGNNERNPAEVSPQAKAEIKQVERTFQAALERWLENRGYWRLTAANAEKALQVPESDLPRGWFGHLVETRRNPLMPDVWIFSSDGRLLQIELKRTWRFQPGQHEMIRLGHWKIAWDVQEAADHVKQWERQSLSAKMERSFGGKMQSPAPDWGALNRATEASR